MINKNLLNTVYFDLSAFPFKDIFSGLYPWEALSQIVPYILKLFENNKISPNFRDRQDVFVGEGTIIHPTVEIEGPAIIGKNCHIKHGSFLRGGCILGNNVHVGHAVEVKHSIMLNDSIAAHLNYIGDSIVGNGVNISGGAIIANFRLDKTHILIKSGEDIVDTGLEKFGAVIGDNTVVGVNSVLNPGTFLGQNSAVYPLKSVKGVHEKNEVLK